MSYPSRALENYVPEPNSGCWLWLGKVAKDTGYGKASFRGREILAHRLFYGTLVGPIPRGLTLDHLCRVRSCVNPAHTEPVTRAVNVMRGDGIAARNARKITCHAGHPFTKRNTYITADGYRQCRECRRVAVNLRRGRTQADVEARRQTCPKGHPYDVAFGTKRRCRTCGAAWLRAYRARKEKKK